MPAWRGLQKVTAGRHRRRRSPTISSRGVGLSRRSREAYVAACLAELDALKPGNVHRHAEGHGMTVADFETERRVSAPAIAQTRARVGARVLGASPPRAPRSGRTPTSASCCFARRSPPPPSAASRLRDSLAAVLGELDLDDARAVFAAIAAANPGGLGPRSGTMCARRRPSPLREAMAAAAERDLVARQYANDFADVFGLGTARLRRRPTRAATAVSAARGGLSRVSHRAIPIRISRANSGSRRPRRCGDDAVGAPRRSGAARRREIAQALAAWDADAEGARPQSRRPAPTLPWRRFLPPTLPPDATNGLRRPRNND